jgi:hypothetical protein
MPHIECTEDTEAYIGCILAENTLLRQQQTDANVESALTQQQLALKRQMIVRLQNVLQALHRDAEMYRTVHATLAAQVQCEEAKRRRVLSETKVAQTQCDLMQARLRELEQKHQRALKEYELQQQQRKRKSSETATDGVCIPPPKKACVPFNNSEARMRESVQHLEFIVRTLEVGHVSHMQFARMLCGHGNFFERGVCCIHVHDIGQDTEECWKLVLRRLSLYYHPDKQSADASALWLRFADAAMQCINRVREVPFRICTNRRVCTSLFPLYVPKAAPVPVNATTTK